jgi:Protein of unknown function (DUF3530).
MKSWILCFCLLWIIPFTFTEAASNSSTPQASAAVAVTSGAGSSASAANPATVSASAASAADTTNQDPEYLAQVQDWQQYPDTLQFGKEWVLLHKSEQSYQQGVAILLPEWQQTASLLPLSKALSKQGFDCVVLLPTPDQLRVNPGDEKQSKQVQQQLEQWSARLAGVDENMNAVKGHRLLIAQGSSAVWVSQLLATEKMIKPDAIVLLNAFYPDKQANAIEATQLSNDLLPTLDLYQDDKTNWLQEATRQRLSAVKRATKLNWRQQTIQDLTDAPMQISDWLTTLGWK